MTQIKLLVLVANLVFLRLVLANSDQNQLGQDHQTASLFDNINSLDFQPNEHTNLLQSTAGELAQPASNSSTRPKSKRSGKSLASNGTSTNHTSSRKQKMASNQQQPLPQLLMSVLGQLEKLDFKRLIADGLKSQQQRRSSSYELLANQTATQTPRAKQMGPVSGEAGNLLSITKQLVKLARSQIGSDLAPAASWLSHSSWLPSLSPSLSPHWLGDDYTSAGFKSDWFWVVVPAVIVIGAGVIVVPLIAAWLISMTMSQNTFTVSAGRRRRRRDVGGASSSMDPQLVADSSHSNLFNMLEFHKLFDEPQLLVNKLSKLHAAIDSVGSSLIKSTLDEYKSSSATGKRKL